MSFFSEYMDFVNDLIMGGKIYRDDRINEIFKSNNMLGLIIFTNLLIGKLISI